ncbi:MAG: hypothetical protein OXT64_12675 [Gammaproteobacteria bacterium]|nr:hypothetical protein [Gammaproteobacteria bacterium]
MGSNPTLGTIPRFSERSAPPEAFDAKLAVQDDMLLVAVEEDAAIGTTMAGYGGHRGWLHKVAVLPQHRRRDAILRRSP